MSPYMGLILLAVQQQRSLLGQRGWSHTETMGGTWVGDAGDAGACSGHRQDLTTARLLQFLARQGWGCVRVARGCVLRGCTKPQDRKKKKKNRAHLFKAPQKSPTSTGSAYAIHVHVHVFAATAVVMLVCGCWLYVGCASRGDERQNRRAKCVSVERQGRCRTYWY